MEYGYHFGSNRLATALVKALRFAGIVIILLRREYLGTTLCIEGEMRCASECRLGKAISDAPLLL